MMATMDSSTLTEAAPYNEKHQAMTDKLDDDIASIRAEIQALSKQRNLLSASLLGSTRIQQKLAQTSATDPLPAVIQSLLSASQSHSQENAYRLALGVTAFPFQDPSAGELERRLLGVRFDISDSQGFYDKPYYILAQRISDNGDDMRIYRHTIPAFIPLRDYEKTYLPAQDEGYGSGETASNQRQTQDLHGLVKHIRHDLVSWTLRCDAIRSLQQQLRLPVHLPEQAEEGECSHSDTDVGRFGIKGLQATSVEATQIKIMWATGAVGRIRISSKGMIEKVVLLDHHGRMRDIEAVLMKDSGSVVDLASKLEAVQEQMQKRTDQEDDEDMEESEQEGSQ